MNRRLVHGLRILIALSPVLVLGLVTCVLATIFVVAIETQAANVEGPAPDASYAVRRAWAERSLGKYFVAAETWIRKNKNIENDIGSVLGVAPIGGPNRYCDGFGECWATMNLQIVGEKGEGVLGLSEVSFDGRTNQPYVEVSKDDWKYHLFNSPED